MTTLKRIAWLLLSAALLFLAACGGAPASTPDPGAIFTAAVETAYAQVTLTAMAASPTPSVPPTPTETPTPKPTNTPLITDTPAAPTNTPFVVVPVGPTSASCDNFLFIADVTIPDGTDVAPGESFEKTWRIQNTGPCAWTTDYMIIPGWGEMMGGPYMKKIPNAVKPGEFLDISIRLVAPNEPGRYFGAWRMANDRQTPFGIALTVVIDVVKP